MSEDREGRRVKCTSCGDIIVAELEVGHFEKCLCEAITVFTLDNKTFRVTGHCHKILSRREEAWLRLVK